MTKNKTWKKQIGTVSFLFTELNKVIYVSVDCKSVGYFEEIKLLTETQSQFEQRVIQTAYQKLLSIADVFKEEAEKQSFAVKEVNDWCLIENLNLKRKSIYGYPYLLFSEELIDLDFNPSGIVEGFYQDGPDEGWVGGIWNNDQDCYSLISINPTHYKEKMGPNA